jgi:hypothetical protein
LKRIALELIIVFLTALLVSQFTDIPFLSISGVIYTLVQLIHLMNSFGSKIPFKEFIVAIMAIQLLLAPYLEYHYFKFEIIGGMSVSENVFYNYALPCTILIQIGLEIFYPKRILGKELFEIFAKRPRAVEARGISLIVIGYLGYLIGEFTPGLIAFDFIFYLLSLCRFIGFLYLWFSGSKFTIFAFIFVIIPFTIEAINSTIFVELIVYSMILLAVYFMKHKTPRLIIYSIFTLGFALLLSIQSVKYSYRKEVSKKSFTGNRLFTLTGALLDQIKNIEELDLKKIGGSVNARINQGWILSDVLNHLGNRPEKISTKYFEREVKGILLPRFIYPEKPTVGDHTKFREYAGYRLSKRVAMTVGVMGDGYGNFGRIGGMIYCFGFGMLTGLFLRMWYKLSFTYPTLMLWGVLIFFYSMRAGDETYTIVNWIIKSSFLVFLYFLFFERKLTMSYFFRLNTKPA